MALDANLDHKRAVAPNKVSDPTNPPQNPSAQQGETPRAPARPRTWGARAGHVTRQKSDHRQKRAGPSKREKNPQVKEIPSDPVAPRYLSAAEGDPARSCILVNPVGGAVRDQ